MSADNENEKKSDSIKASLGTLFFFLIDSWAWMRLTLNIIRGQDEKLFTLQTFAQVSS